MGRRLARSSAPIPYMADPFTDTNRHGAMAVTSARHPAHRSPDGWLLGPGARDDHPARDAAGGTTRRRVDSGCSPGGDGGRWLLVEGEASGRSCGRTGWVGHRGAPQGKEDG